MSYLLFNLEIDLIKDESIGHFNEQHSYAIHGVGGRGRRRRNRTRSGRPDYRWCSDASRGNRIDAPEGVGSVGLYKRDDGNASPVAQDNADVKYLN